MNQLDIIAE